MLGGEEILDHLFALAVIWGAAIAGGLFLALLLPLPSDRRDYLFACPVLGCAWWTAVFYLFAFPGGLIIASATTAVLFVAAIAAILVRRRRRGVKLRISPMAGIVLLVGCISYVTPLFVQHAPFGRESWKAAVSARQIGENAGMRLADREKYPSDDLVLQGPPVLAGLAVRAGSTPLGAVLAWGQFVMSMLIIATYMFVRLAARRKVAAVIAVATCWIMSGTQSMIVTGKLAMLTTVALGLLACRMIMDYGRHSRLISIIPVGMTIGAMPMINALGSGCWILFAAGPTALFSILFSRSRLQTLSAGLLAGATAAIVAGAAFLAARNELAAGNYQWLRPGDFEFASVQNGILANLGLGWYIADYLGLALVLPGFLCLIMLVVAGRWAAITIILLPTSMIAAAAIISVHWLRPAAQLLGPRHDLVWLGPVAAMLLAMAWRWGALRIKSRAGAKVLAGVFLAVAMLTNVGNFQMQAAESTMDEQVWQGLKWAAGRLDPEKDMVLYMFDTPGGFLPAMCGVRAAEFSSLKEKNGPYSDKAFTYIFHIDSTHVSQDYMMHYQTSESAAKRILKARPNSVVFRNDRVTIYQITGTDAADQL